MPADALSTPARPAPSTIFARLMRGRIDPSPWVAFEFDQADAVLEDDGTPTLNSVGQPLFRGRGQLTVLRCSVPAKLGELEQRVVTYVLGGKSADDAETTVAYEELAACRAAGTLDAILALGYSVSGTFIPWT